MRLLTRLARGAGVAALVAAGLIAVPTIATATTPVVGHVYVNDNTAGTNTIGAFDQHSDGSLTPMVGSPFSAGGAGTGTVVGSKGRSRRPRTATGCWWSTPAATRSPCWPSVPTGRSRWLPVVPCRRAGSRRLASPSTAASCTSPIRETERTAATTRDSPSATTDG